MKLRVLRVRAPAQRVTAIGGPGRHVARTDPVTSPSLPPLPASFPLVETQKEVTGGDAFWQVAAAFLSRSAGTPSGGATRRSASSQEQGSGSKLR